MHQYINVLYTDVTDHLSDIKLHKYEFHGFSSNRFLDGKRTGMEQFVSINTLVVNDERTNIFFS